MLLQGPDLLIDLGVLDVEQFAVNCVVDEQVHVLRRSGHVSWHLQLIADLVRLVLDVLEVLLGERLVLEQLEYVSSRGAHTVSNL